MVSGPTIREERIDVALSGGTPITPELSHSMSDGISDEDDYQARYGTAEIAYEAPQLPATLTASVTTPTTPSTRRRAPRR